MLGKRYGQERGKRKNETAMAEHPMQSGGRGGFKARPVKKERDWEHWEFGIQGASATRCEAHTAKAKAERAVARPHSSLPS